DPASVAGAAAVNVRLVDASGAPAALTPSFSAGNSILTLRPMPPLASDTSYTLPVEKGKDLTGYPMAAPMVGQFQAVDHIAPPPPPAGALSASIAVDGNTTVRATQGIAGPRDTVSIENATRGTSTPVLLDPNLGFLVIVEAAAGDVLKLQIVDPAGNERVV